MNFHQVILMMYNDVPKAFKVETCTVYLYFFHIVFNFPYLWKVTNGKNKQKKTNHIYNPPPIQLEGISLVLLGLPCYHHEMEVILLNVNISIQTSVVDIILFPKFFGDPLFAYYQRVL